jgi:hypothetical protein
MALLVTRAGVSGHTTMIGSAHGGVVKERVDMRSVAGLCPVFLRHVDELRGHRLEAEVCLVLSVPERYGLRDRIQSLRRLQVYCMALSRPTYPFWFKTCAETPGRNLALLW